MDGTGSAPAKADIIETTRHEGMVASLTFDDGPHPVHTPRLLSVLREHDVKAVFCLWGDHVREHPEIVREIVADGHILGNHTMHHDDMGSWPPERIRADLLEAAEAIRQAVPDPEVRIPYFRAPYGSWGRTPQAAAALGMRPLGWRLDITDWEPPGTAVLIERLVEGITPRAVVLLHDAGGDRSQTVDAVAHIIPRFQAQGWRFTLPATPA